MSITKSDDPRCDHTDLIHIVTNQPDGYDKDRSLRSAWICGQRACVLDAMAWVERGTGEKASVKPPHPEVQS
jgi:predicted RNA-binding protein YlxR (DUF448 family)